MSNSSIVPCTCTYMYNSQNHISWAISIFSSSLWVTFFNRNSYTEQYLYMYMYMYNYVNGWVVEHMYIIGLSLFFKILPISNTADSIAIFWPPLTFFIPNLAPFPTWSTTATNLLIGTQKSPRFVGLNQIQCSPIFDWNRGKQNDPTACWHKLHTISSSTAREMHQVPIKACGQGRWNHKLRGQQRALPPSKNH